MRLRSTQFAPWTIAAPVGTGYGIVKECDIKGDNGHLEEGSEWLETGFPGAIIRPSDLTPADLERARQAPSQFIGKSHSR